MFKRDAALLLVWVLALPGLVHADALEFPISIDDGPLRTGLKALQSQTGIELLYDGDAIGEFRSPSVVGKLTTEAALQQLLSETGLTVRRAASGAWIIERRAAPALAQQDVAVAEILVVGRRTQNADIRRTEDDVQPYTVSTQEEIVRSHRDNIDQFLSSRVTSNTTIIPSHASQSADFMSSINLRGLGEQDTIVLVDGRRMPSIPVPNTGFRQADLNAIPLHAIERIEVLTGAAGGIHGFGAVGGVVNIILDRDVEGLEVHTTQGITSRGDARRHSLEASFGHSFRDGATEFMMFAAHQEMDTLLVRDRGFAARDRRRVYELAPEQFPGTFPVGDSITVRSLYAIDPVTSELIVFPDLTYKPEFGGGQLGSNVAYLPVGFSGNGAALVAELNQRAGELDFSLPDPEARRDLGSNPQSDALLANLSHRFESGWEAYADVLILRGGGESSGDPLSTLLEHGTAFIWPESPVNPFNELITVSYPIQGLENRIRKRLDTRRYTAGIEAVLPFDWRGTAEASWGQMRYAASSVEEVALLGTGFFLFGDESDRNTNPLGNWGEFDRVIKTDVMRSTRQFDVHSRFGAQTLRLAGPVFDTQAGPTMLTVLAERRSDRMPDNTELLTLSIGEEPFPTEVVNHSRATTTTSIYGELRTRLFDESARMPLIRGLEIQLAARHDSQADNFEGDPELEGFTKVRMRIDGTAYTVGAKISPLRWLMLRGSYATGEQPPPMASLIDESPFPSSSILTSDPRRGGTELGQDGEFLIWQGGNSRLRTKRVNTLFLGAVFTPTGPDGARMAFDYSRINATRDVRFTPIERTLENEERWPERVVRAPLTEEDRANGYTGGIVELLDVRQMNDGLVEVETFDMRAEWPLEFLGGRLRLYADATYHKRNDRRVPVEPAIPWAGYFEGPLKRRANGGFDWSRNQLTFGANLQYFSSSLIFERAYANYPELVNHEDVAVQGSTRIASQSYVDLYASWRIPMRNLGAVDSLAFDFGVINALDKAPPRESVAVTSIGPSYSRYGDARQRRFELGVSCRF